jgi:DnaA family protein
VSQKAHAYPQLALNLRLRDSSTFSNFLPARNAEAVERLIAFAAGTPTPPLPAVLYLWGEPGAGKTHLLEAACHAVQAHGVRSVYVPLAEAAQLAPSLLDDLEQAMLICIDDLEAVAGESSWEAALFALYERAQASAARFLITAAANPRHLGLAMPELRTRLGAGWVYHLHALTDEEKLAALRLRARRRGLDLPDDVAAYILARHARDTHALFGLLDRLDRAALAAQRRLTIPFVRGFE